MEKLAASILVVDDELGMREGCRRALTPHGFRVSVAEHGAEALQALRGESFDLILLDAMMPGMSGPELLDRIHEHDPDVVCVMITGYATVELAAQAMKHGAQDFLPKPFTSDELLEVVQRGLKERWRQLMLKQQQEREEEALQLERTRADISKLAAIEGRFMLVLVHELRNPAGVIKNYLQLMQSGYVDADEWDSYLENLGLRAGQLLNMLDDLLELAHLKGAHDPSKAEPIALADSLERVAGSLRPMAEAKKLDLEIEIQARPTVLGHATHFQSLWTNLLDNAIRYTPAGQVAVALLEEGDQVVATVSDTGTGISTEEMTHIFQEFYRSEAAKAEEELGTGLGLSIVEQIVRIHRGTIQVDSVPAQGSTFTVRPPKPAPEH
jgi:signal transduction histidine kinase